MLVLVADDPSVCTAAAKDENDLAYLGHVQREIGGVAERIKEIFSS
jgi:hypothetical protein